MIDVFFVVENEVPHQLLAAYTDLLSPDERSRAERFVFARHHRQYVIAHALLRTSLSRYQDRTPVSWEFTRNTYGRPEIAAHQQDQTAPLHFNLSHTEGLSICAISRAGEVGIDAERCGNRFSQTVARHSFAPAEYQPLFALPPARREDRFIDIWTLKEAYIKARGMGLALPLDKFWFRFQGEELDFSIANELGDDAASWTFHRFRPTPEHRAALATRHGSHLPVQVTRTVPLDVATPLSYNRRCADGLPVYG